MILLLVLIAFLLLLLNGGRTVGVWRLVSQVFKIILALIIIKIVLMAIGLGAFLAVGNHLFR